MGVGDNTPHPNHVVLTNPIAFPVVQPIRPKVMHEDGSVGYADKIGVEVERGEGTTSSSDTEGEGGDGEQGTTTESGTGSSGIVLWSFKK